MLSRFVGSIIVLCAAAAHAQIIHQPAAHLPDVVDVALGGVAHEVLRDGNFFSLPKDALIGPEDRTIVREYKPLVCDGDSCYAPDSVVVDVAQSLHSLLRCVLVAVACISVMACGVIPALLLPPETGVMLHETLAHRHLNSLLAFSVGSLLGDVFLHVLPEAWSSPSPECSYTSIGLSTIAGILFCFLVEKCCAKSEESQHQAAAIINLIANLIDNFTHGLAVASSFFVSLKFGLLTTIAILLHEIPHEISDFAILLRADFDRWSAIKAQLVTSAGGLVGAIVALTANVTTAHGCTHILAFTAGGFINIALVQVLPELLRADGLTRRDHAKQLLYVGIGIAVMALVNSLSM